MNIVVFTKEVVDLTAFLCCIMFIIMVIIGIILLFKEMFKKRWA